MSYTMVDDQFARRDDVRAAGRDGRAILYAALTEASDADGLITAQRLADIAYFADVRAAARAAAQLVEVGLWHDPETMCSDCAGGVDEWHGTELQPGQFLIHAWWTFHQAAKGKDNPVAKWREARRKHLNRSKPLVARIRNRDRDLCRYCGRQTEDSSGPNKKGAYVRQLDHVDPYCTDGPEGYGNTWENVVVACRTCNGRKRDNRPDEVGMTLHPPGTTRADIKAAGQRRMRPDPIRPHPAVDPADPTQDPAVDPAYVRAHTRGGTGPGQAGSGSDLRPDAAGSTDTAVALLDPPTNPPTEGDQP